MTTNNNQSNQINGRFTSDNIHQKNEGNSFTININGPDKIVSSSNTQEILAVQLLKLLLIAGISLVVISLVATKLFGYNVIEHLTLSWNLITPSISAVIGYCFGVRPK
ncbi:hypothetical protein [Desulfovibrio sp. DV]|uniref:hypothetical protein n=1 Tax=Desulfovibrio sp. DV TaxID=1844708 RepID=UPI000B1C0EA4|nr:hypothetical protein [Desulfovibrio sp. DV]